MFPERRVQQRDQVRSSSYVALCVVLSKLSSITYTFLLALQTLKPRVLTRPEARTWGEQTRRSTRATRRNVACACCWRKQNRIAGKKINLFCGQSRRASDRLRLRTLWRLEPLNMMNNG